MANEKYSRVGKTNKQWTIRTVDGIPFPRVPMTFTHELFVFDRDSYEDMNGNLHRTVLGEKDKFLLAFAPMYQAQVQSILNQVKKKEFYVEYEDYWNPKVIRKELFYRGDTKKSPMMILQDGTVLYNQLSFNLIMYNTRRVNT